MFDFTLPIFMTTYQFITLLVISHKKSSVRGHESLKNLLQLTQKWLCWCTDVLEKPVVSITRAHKRRWWRLAGTSLFWGKKKNSKNIHMLLLKRSLFMLRRKRGDCRKRHRWSMFQSELLNVFCFVSHVLFPGTRESHDVRCLGGWTWKSSRITKTRLGNLSEAGSV